MVGKLAPVGCRATGIAAAVDQFTILPAGRKETWFHYQLRPSRSRSRGREELTHTGKEEMPSKHKSSPRLTTPTQHTGKPGKR